MQESSPDRVRLTATQAQDLSERALRGIGYDAQEAHIVANHVMDAALCGYEYSGLPKILNVAEHQRFKEPRQPMRPLRETSVSVLYDGGNQCGMITMYHATQSAIERARQHGFAVTGVTNSWVSGRNAHYVEMIARAGLIGIHTVSSTYHVAPLGGARAALGTNPISFGFPTAGEPFVVDMGTSATMSTDLIFRQRRGEQLPEDVAIDANGNPTRDPSAALKGAILPFGGYKGFGLALAMQALGVFAGSGHDRGKAYGYLVIAMQPDLMVPLEEFRRDVTAMLAKVKSTPRQQGVDEIRIPSERSFRERERNRRDGVEIDRKIYDALLDLCTE